ncbi:hypothetical protein DNC80_06250 [Flavobacterium sp. SOK18b]|uniref:hypothetical protein n=1 Tax=Flavobacterium sp. SOK18b TaxID=797900 RepID=UPI0015FD02ED|nr:hypothetical protein [Flavobacterium sp. SOK18b]MBB1193270.1 hypothetical protein [Flavobacterium sp. SOK18b]
MNPGTLLIRTSKSTDIYNKSYHYNVKIANALDCEMNYKNNRKEITLAPGKYSLLIDDGKTQQTQEINLKAGEIQTFTINASVTYQLGLGLLIGIQVAFGAFLCYQFFVLDRFFLPQIIIFVATMFLFTRDNFGNSFALSFSKKRF